MTPSVLTTYGQRGIILWLDEGRLRFRSTTPLTPEEATELRTRRAQILEALEQTPETPAHACRASEDLETGATWCRTCWRYKNTPCTPTSKRLTTRENGRWLAESPEIARTPRGVAGSKFAQDTSGARNSGRTRARSGTGDNVVHGKSGL